MAEKNSQNGKDQFLKDFVLELKDLNDIEYTVSEFQENSSIKELKQYYLNQFELAFGKHLLRFVKAFALGKQFAERVKDESDS